MDLEKTMWGCLLAVVMGGIVAGAVCLVNVAKSDGRVDYCRVLYDNSSYALPAYRIVGHRNWRGDIDVAVTTSAEDAAVKLKTLCPN